MFEAGFLGTAAPTYMDIVTIFFGMLPFLMGYAILMAIRKRFALHHALQLIIFAVNLVVVVIFEIGVRISGGFDTFMLDSSANYTSLVTFLIVHIIIAVISVVLWATLIYKSVKGYNSHTFMAKPHKQLAKIVYAGMTITSISGIMIYYFLFMYK